MFIHVFTNKDIFFSRGLYMSINVCFFLGGWGYKCL